MTFTRQETKPKLLDLFCCQGGASAGYTAAGFDVVGVDLSPQPRYPYRFVQADALSYLMSHGDEFDAFHASPPCQAFTLCQRIQDRDHPDLIAPTRAAFQEIGKPWVIENVEGAPLIDPVLLCGEMFGLRTYRHRLFESNISLTTGPHPVHVKRTTKMGRAVREGENMHVVGNFSGVDLAREVMSMPWASRDGLREAIPPAYSQFIGAQLLTHLSTGVVL
jgi:DNA (cytosine-5)-methyltransferase 1